MLVASTADSDEPRIPICRFVGVAAVLNDLRQNAEGDFVTLLRLNIQPGGGFDLLLNRLGDALHPQIFQHRLEALAGSPPARHSAAWLSAPVPAPLRRNCRASPRRHRFPVRT